MKNNFEPLNSNLLESGFDGLTSRYYQVFMVTPVVKPNLMHDQEGHPLEYDMEDFGKPEISDDINDINNYFQDED